MGRPASRRDHRPSRSGPRDPLRLGRSALRVPAHGRDAVSRKERKMDDSTFSMVLFSGTDDKLNAAAVLIAGAAAMGRKVDVFLQYWALDAFRTDRITKDHGVVPEAGPEGAELFQRRGGQRTGARFFGRRNRSATSRSTRARSRWRCSVSPSTTSTRSSTTVEGVASSWRSTGPIDVRLNGRWEAMTRRSP